jgi:CRP-like cAMP-binding protein
MGQASCTPRTSGTAGYEAHPAFAAWPREAIRALNSASVVVDIPRGTTLYTAGDPAAGLYLLRAGQIELVMPAERSRCRVSHVVEAGGTIGLGPTLSGRPYEFTARAARASSALFVPRKKFLEILSRFPTASISVSQVLSREIELAYRRLLALRS